MHPEGEDLGRCGAGGAGPGDGIKPGMDGAIFLPGKRTNMVFLLYQLALYPLLAILGIMGAGE